MINKLQLKEVQYMPRELEPGVLYFSKEFEIASHLCPCGCGNKIITPIGPTDWSITIRKSKPTLFPSIGNWQIPCKSHYWIRNGLINWSYQWTEDQIKAGRQEEVAKRENYFSNSNQKKDWSIVKPLLKRFLRRKK
jgi:hypothetical protein